MRCIRTARLAAVGFFIGTSTALPLRRTSRASHFTIAIKRCSGSKTHAPKPAWTRWGAPNCRSMSNKAGQAARLWAMASRKPSSRPSRCAIRSRNPATSLRNSAICSPTCLRTSDNSVRNERWPAKISDAKAMPTPRMVHISGVMPTVYTETGHWAELCARWRPSLPLRWAEADEGAFRGISLGGAMR